MHPNTKTNLIPKFVLKLDSLERLQSTLNKDLPVKIEAGTNTELAAVKISQADEFKFAVPCFNHPLGLQMAKQQITERLISLGYECQ